jgi:hypothetical protein
VSQTFVKRMGWPGMWRDLRVVVEGGFEVMIVVCE